MKGHRNMHEQVKFKTPDYIGKRHMMRLCSDAYGKGIVRSNQESINLRINGTKDEVTSAESFHTASFVQFPGIDLVQWREAVYTSSNFTDMLSAVAVDWRNPKRTTPYMRNFVYLYGHRPKDIDEVWYMSPYEFMVYWKIDLAQYPLDAEIPDDDDAYEAKLTSHGKAKLKHATSSKEKNPKLIPGVDYVVKEKRLQQTWYNWLPFPENEFTLSYRHDWVLKRNQRPRDPSFARCPMPKRGDDQKNRNAALIMTYFHPFTLNPTIGTEHVPFLGDLCAAGKSWHESLLAWFDGRVLCREAKLYIDNFLSMTRTRPTDDEEMHSEENFSDEELIGTADNIDEVLKTRIGSGPRRQQDIDTQEAGEENDAHIPESSREAFQNAKTLWKC
jgi:hypothetical protein